MYLKSKVTITQILDAAQRSFVSNNYNDITMAAIAQEANITKGAIYHHFESKEDLFLQMMVRYLNGIQVLLGQAVDETLGGPREQLSRLTTAFLEQPLEDQRVIQLVRRDANRFTDGTRQTLIAAYQEALPNQIEAIIAEGIANGQIKGGDARLIAWQHVAIVEVYLSNYARQKFNTPEAMAKYLTSVFFDGVGMESS
ncbi:MAG: TetR/AcrR family transcriptional regulator [Anaerolineales bacterium]|nr:TetR/AcrR family transcriptional regulator [Anaerolineales bacterium]